MIKSNNPGYIYLPYTLQDNLMVISEGTFAPKKSLYSGRYAPVNISGFYGIIPNKENRRKKKIEKIFDEKVNII